MRGMIFTEFLDMVEDEMGLAVKDRVLRVADPPGGGIYTAVGDYPASELIGLVDVLASETGHARTGLLEHFGRHMFAHFTAHYGRFFAGAGTCFDFLGRIESYIHVEVRKLYPGAELPAFTYPLREPGRLIMEYHSPRGMADFAHGLIGAAIAHFGEPIGLIYEDLGAGTGTAARFTLERRA